MEAGYKSTIKSPLAAFFYSLRWANFCFHAPNYPFDIHRRESETIRGIFLVLYFYTFF